MSAALSTSTWGAYDGRVKRFTITTPIYYVNGLPHLGHTYTTVAADAFARAKRMQGYEVLFATGTDEHGLKSEKAARQRGLSPQAYVDEMSAKWRSHWEELGISFTDFIRTTEPRHKQTVQAILSKLRASGDVYPGTYDGWYCTPCESFYSEDDVGEERLCPNDWCRRPTDWVEERGYYFKLSAYQEHLLEHLDAHPDFVLPDFRCNEVRRFIERGLKDVYISRASFKWGVPLPFDRELVTYVWFDALLNYVTVTGYGQDEERFGAFWPADVHLIAKDILRFHAVIWPAMLQAAGLPLPRRVFAHGFWNVQDEKMSKSKGSFVTTADMADDLKRTFGADFPTAVDAIRYFLFREVTFGLDGNFRWQAFRNRYERDLANDLGNLFSRVLSMISRYRQGEVPRASVDPQVKEICEQSAARYFDAMDSLKLHEAVGAFEQLVQFLNRQVELYAPWKLTGRDEEGLDRALYNLVEGLRFVTVLSLPLLPHTGEKMRQALSLDMPEPRLTEGLRFGASPAPVRRVGALFPRKTLKQEVAMESSPQSLQIEIADFQKLDLVVAEVVEARLHPNADKLLLLKLDTGAGQLQVVAGIRGSYTPEEMVGKQVVLLRNLKPVTLRGEVSEGMVLAAEGGDGPVLLVPERPVSVGAKVR